MSPSPKDEKAFFEKLLAEEEDEDAGGEAFVEDPDEYLLVDNKQQVCLLLLKYRSYFARAPHNQQGHNEIVRSTRRLLYIALNEIVRAILYPIPLFPTFVTYVPKLEVLT